MSRPYDLNKSLLPFDQHNTLIAVIEMSQSSWLVAGVVQGVERHPLENSSQTSRHCFGCSSAGERRRPRLALRSRALRWLSRRVATGFGWRDGSGRAT